MNPETLDALRAAYQQWHDSRGGSADAWMALLHDDVRVRSAADGGPGLEFSAARDGKAAMYDYFTGLAADWEMLHYTVEHLLVDGEQVAMFGRCAYRNRKTGKVAETDLANRWRFRDGLAVEFYELYDTAKAFAAAVPDPA